MRWTKKLSRTDAQQKTRGYPVPYIRLTRSDAAFDTQSTFRQTFFSPTRWSPGHFGQHAVEEQYVVFDVIINGVAKGQRRMLVTHDSSRQNNNNTPNTWIHYDDATIRDLRSINYTGKTISITRTLGGRFEFEIY